MSIGQHRDFSRQLVQISLIVRLLAIMVALLGLVGNTMTATVLAAVVVLSTSGLSVLLSPAVADFVLRHPLVLLVDLLIVLGVVSVLGVESPLVLATFSTALIIGVLFERRVAVLSAIVLVAGYLLVERIWPGDERGFMIALGVPALYVILIAVGLTVRGAHELQLSTSNALAEAEQRAVAADERARLAREMHDSLGKTLHGIALAAEALPMWVERDRDQAVGHARELASAAQQAADEGRRLLVRMRADQPDRPFAEVLTGVCTTWSGQSGVPCRVTVDGVVDLGTDTRYELLAILGEALENISRHAGATSVEVSLQGRADGAARVSVRDDGCGFEPPSDGRSPAGHFGLTGMDERARSVGMTLSLSSQPGRGSVVVVDIPGPRTGPIPVVDEPLAVVAHPDDRGGR